MRIETFRDPVFFEDHFCVGWSKISGGTSSFASDDGELAKLNSGDQPYAIIEKNLPGGLNVTTHSLLVCRIENVDGSASVDLHLGGGVWYSYIYAKTSPGVYTADISNAGTPNKIRLKVGGVGKIADFDYAIIAKSDSQVPIDAADVCGRVDIVKPLLNAGVQTATFTLYNVDAYYSAKILNHDFVLIWLARAEADLGKVSTKEFGGRVVRPTKHAPNYGDYELTLECESHGYELICSSALFTADYSSTNGRTILEAALAVCTRLIKHPMAVMWFDNGGSSGSTDDRINSAHTVEYSEVMPRKVFEEILEKASNPSSVIGFDAYETPAGCLVGHLRNSLDFAFATVLKPLPYSRSEDRHKVINKQTVYGAKTKNYPSNLDSWTESTDGWTVVSGQPMELDAAIKRKGSYSIKMWTPSGGGTVNIYRTFSALRYYAKFGGWVRMPGNLGGGTAYVRLWAPDSSNYFQADVKAFLEASCILAWGMISLALGRNQEYNADNNPDGIWTKTGSPQWSQISGLQFVFTCVGATSYFNFDGDLGFLSGPYSSTAEDGTSQDAYGVCEAEPMVDEALKSDAECLAKAQSIVTARKDPLIVYEAFVIDGVNGLHPGDRVHIQIAPESIDEYSRAVEVHHIVQGSIWDIGLKVTNEPQLTDEVFKLLIRRMGPLIDFMRSSGGSA
jgi:hypothetical protein